jgi:hypothetical protein
MDAARETLLFDAERRKTVAFATKLATFRQGPLVADIVEKLRKAPPVKIDAKHISVERRRLMPSCGISRSLLFS